MPPAFKPLALWMIDQPENPREYSEGPSNAQALRPMPLPLWQKVTIVLLSLGLHGTLALVLTRVTIDDQPRERPALVVAMLESPPLRPKARTQFEILNAENSQRKGDHGALLEKISPQTPPPTIALPSAPTLHQNLLTDLLGGQMNGVDWSRVQQTFQYLDQPDMGRRGSFEGTLHRFRRINRVRTGTQWFKGRNKETAEDKLYAYRCQFPGRTSNSVLTDPQSWIGIDYTTTLHWPKVHAGTYQWRLTSDDGAIFQIDGKDIINHDGHHDFRPKEAEIEIGAGNHTIRLAYILGPKSKLGVILHYRRMGGKGWQVFDLRPLLQRRHHDGPTEPVTEIYPTKEALQ